MMELRAQTPEAEPWDWQTKMRETQQVGLPMFSSKGKDAMEFMTAVEWVLSRCKFVFSTTGLLALVPKAAQQYDTIVQFEGTKMPFVVRPVGDTGLNWLVGPCYVHGIMHCPSPEHDFEISSRGGVIAIV
jgi:hypothetical protein